MSWDSVPICGACWQAYSYGAFGEIRQPTALIDPPQDVCGFCGNWAEQGIYIRAEVEKVPFYGLEEPLGPTE